MKSYPGKKVALSVNSIGGNISFKTAVLNVQASACNEKNENGEGKFVNPDNESIIQGPLRQTGFHVELIENEEEN